MTKRYLVTWAQNATPVHSGFFAAMQQWCAYNKAELVVIPGRYKNPTSLWSKRAEGDDWWAPAAKAHMLNKRKSVHKELRLYADISIQPTASLPLDGFERFAGRTSGVFGHPRRQLKVIPTGTRKPRVLWSTGACTVPNYVPSKAGKKARAHHVLGALAIEVDGGAFFARHVTANKQGVFTDLDRTFGPTGSAPAAPPASITLGDYHAGSEDYEVLAATEQLVRDLKPANLVLHDVLDFRTRNHHDRTLRQRYSKRDQTVKGEVSAAANALLAISGWGQQTTHVVRSNHDEAFERWLDEAEPAKNDLPNAPYWFSMNAAAFHDYDYTGQWPNMFERECRLRGVPDSVRFLKRNESLRIAGVEHGFHGDKGPNGARGTAANYAKLGAKVTIGDKHTPSIIDGAFVCGVTCKLDHGYNLLPSTWLHAHTVLHADGKRQLLVIVKGRYRGGKRGKK